MKNIITSVRGPTRNNSIMFVIMDDPPNRKFVNFSNVLDSPGRSYIEFLDYENSPNRAYIDFADIGRSPFARYIEFVDVYSNFEAFSKEKVEYVIIKDKPYLLLSKGAYQEQFGSSDSIDHFEFNKGLRERIIVPDNFSRIATFNRNLNDISYVSDSIVIAKGKLFDEYTDYLDIPNIILAKEINESILHSDSIQNFIFNKSLSERLNISENIIFYSEKSFVDSFYNFESRTFNFTKSLTEKSEIKDQTRLSLSKLLNSSIRSEEKFQISYNKISEDKFYNKDLKYLHTEKPFSEEISISDNSILNSEKVLLEESILKDSGDLFHYSYTLNNTYFAEKYVGVQINF